MATNCKSVRLASAAARSTFLPMRPNPEIATFTVIFIASLQRSIYVFTRFLNKGAAINWTRGHGVNAASPGVLNIGRKQSSKFV